MHLMDDIRTIRTEKLKLSQAELAAKLGVKQATVSRWETGELKFDERTRLAIEALAARPKRKRAMSSDKAVSA